MRAHLRHALELFFRKPESNTSARQVSHGDDTPPQFAHSHAWEGSEGGGGVDHRAADGDLLRQLEAPGAVHLALAPATSARRDVQDLAAATTDDDDVDPKN